jgi:DNA-directed RNA polymerase subunit RPC12/RpoP
LISTLICDIEGCSNNKDQGYKTQKSLNDHKQDYHTTNGKRVVKVKCSECDAEVGKDYLEQHMEIHNKNRETWNCNHCGHDFQTKLGYDQHQREFAEEIQWYEDGYGKFPFYRNI